jgi:hypothetical protein
MRGPGAAQHLEFAFAAGSHRAMDLRPVLDNMAGSGTIRPWGEAITPQGDMLKDRVLFIP